MSARSTLARAVASGAALAAILVVAAVVAHTAPSEEVWQAPMVVSGVLGERIGGRNIEATVDEVRVAETVTVSTGWSGTTSGVWIVVDASVSAVVDEFGARLGTANLVIGAATYSASERPDLGSIQGMGLTIGIAQSGPLLFEVPRSLLSTDAASAARIQLAISNDPRLDSLIVVTVDLTSIEIQRSIETGPIEWGRP